ncbi:MAG: NUDIX domain-containing protein, partial [Candidatus Aenigmarchaeota archaeon]|nr:NUDIX domain-containing protein [Candidatus Aenigmarchaeota archaeon]
MNERDVIKLIDDMGKRLPHFPDGRINYTTSASAPVVVVFVRYKDKILLLKRGDRVLTYKNKWQTVAGYWDEPVRAREKILEELREEIGIRKRDIASMKIGAVRRDTDAAIGKTW